MSASFLPGALASVVLACAAPVASADLFVGVQPMLLHECAGANFSALAGYLSDRVDGEVVVSENHDTGEFRRALLGGDFDVVIATEHYFRNSGAAGVVEEFATTNTVRDYQLLAHRDGHIVEAGALVGHAVAGESSPSQAAQTFVAFFPDPIRQPEYRPTRSVEEAWQLFQAREVEAVLVPARGAAQRSTCVRTTSVLREVRLTLPVIVAVGKRVDAETRTRLSLALRSLGRSMEGLLALDAAVLTGFEPQPGSHAAALSQ